MWFNNLNLSGGAKLGLFFLGGLAVGALGAIALSRGKLDIKPLASEIVSRGMDVKDAVMGKVESFKEDLQDIAAEARQKQEDRKNAQS